jgi:hypothetical protein
MFKATTQQIGATDICQPGSIGTLLFKKILADNILFFNG